MNFFFSDFEPPLLVCKPPLKLKITPEKLKNQSSQSENDSNDEDDISDGEETFKRKIAEKIKSKRGAKAGVVRNLKNLD